MPFFRHLSRERESSRFAKRAAVVSQTKGFYSSPPVAVKGPSPGPRLRFDIVSKKAQLHSALVEKQRALIDKNKIIYAQWLRASDRRRFHPAGQNAWPSNVFGAAALLKKTTPSKFETSALPCVDRQIRRQVMFAKKKAGTAYYKKKRRTWRSNIHC